MTVSAVQKAGWAIAWARVTGLPRLERALTRTSTDHPNRQDLRDVRDAAKAIIEAATEAEALLDSVSRK